MASSFSIVEKNAEQMQKFESEIGKGMDVALQILDDLAMNPSEECGEMSEFAESKISELKSYMQQLIQMEGESQQYLRAVDQMKNEVQASRDTPIELESCLKRGLQQSRNVASNYENHPKYLEFVETVEEIMKPSDSGLATPSFDPGDEDSELMMTEETISTVDPISRLEIVTAVRNKKCNHLYDLHTMKAHIKHRKGKARCPIGGCGNASFVSLDDLQPDRNIQKHIDRKKKSVLS